MEARHLINSASFGPDTLRVLVRHSTRSGPASKEALGAISGGKPRASSWPTHCCLSPAMTAATWRF
jgi:hypothetical protein